MLKHTLPLNEGLCQQKGDIRNVYVVIRRFGAGDTPVVNVNQDQAISFLEGRDKTLTRHRPLKPCNVLAVPETVPGLGHPALCILCRKCRVLRVLAMGDSDSKCLSLL